MSVCTQIKLTSWLWRAAAQQLEVQVVGAKILTFQVLEQLPEGGPERVSAVQTESIGGLFDLEVLILTNGTRLHQVELGAHGGSF